MTPSSSSPTPEASPLRAEREAMIARLMAKPSGLAWCSQYSAFADQVIGEVYRESMAELASPPRLALIATGGYGRKELSPYSDLDLAVVPLDDTHPDLERGLKSLFAGIQRRCGQEMGLKVGYSFRTLPEVPGLDAATRTALIDSRLIAGSEEAFAALLEEVWREFPSGHFLIAKIEERLKAHRRWHDTPLVTTPHLKEGAGGLRCFQASNWIGMALGERSSRPTPSYDRVLRTRNLVHALAGRALEELTLEKRVAVAGQLAKEPRIFASELSEDMLSLHRSWLERLETIPRSRFRLTQMTWAEGGEVRIGRRATAVEAVTAVSLGSSLSIRPPLTLGDLRSDELSPDLVAAISRGEKTLRAIDEAGLLEVILPELTSCRHLMPRDSSHRYTVFEHTLRALRRIEGLKDSEPFGDIKAGLRNPGLLALAVLLHDVGKSDPSQEHSLSGARMARAVCDRWGLNKAEASLVVWLVEHHLDMARFLRLKDVQNPEAVYEFAQFVESEDKLDLLTILTWADIGAVNPEAWTPLQEALMLHLNRSARAVIAENSPKPDPGDARRRISRHLLTAPLDDGEVEAFLAQMPAHYVFATPPDRAALHMEMSKQVLEEAAAMRTLDRPGLGFTEFIICAPDDHGLLAKILAVFYAHDLRLSSVRASTSTGPRPIAVDVICAGLGERSVPPAIAARVLSDLRAILSGAADPSQLLEAKGKDPERRQEILRWHWHPGSPGHLEVRAPRGRGLAYRLSKLIFQQGWSIHGATLSQWAGQGAASFALTGAKGQDLTQEDLERVLGTGGKRQTQV